MYQNNYIRSNNTTVTIGTAAATTTTIAIKI